MTTPTSASGAHRPASRELDPDTLVAVEFTLLTRLIGNLLGDLLDAPPDWRSRDDRLTMLKSLAASREHLARGASLHLSLTWDEVQSRGPENPIGFARN